MLENIMKDIAANQSDSVIDLNMIGPLPSPHISTIVLPFLVLYNIYLLYISILPRKLVGGMDIG